MRTDLEFHNEIIDTRPFDQWAYKDVGWQETIGLDSWNKYFVTLAAIEPGRYPFDDDSYGYYDGEVPQGWQGVAHLIFKVTYNDGEGDAELFFKKEGTVSSYNATSWDGKWTRVTPTRKEVVTYEFS